MVENVQKLKNFSGIDLVGSKTQGPEHADLLFSCRNQHKG